jgi:hypothetical protein
MVLTIKKFHSCFHTKLWEISLFTSSFVLIKLQVLNFLLFVGKFDTFLLVLV